MFRYLLIAVVMILPCTNLMAKSVAVEGIPDKWRLENYVGNGVAVWFSGSTCQNGLLVFGASATVDDKNRFFSLLMAAKISDQVIGVIYEDSSNCEIISFYLKET